MRVFKSLTLLPEKLSLVYLANPSQSPSMPSQVLSAGSSLLKVGVGLGGVFSALCPSAIAAPLAATESTFPDASQSVVLIPLPVAGASEAMPDSAMPMPQTVTFSIENRPFYPDLPEAAPKHVQALELESIPLPSSEAPTALPPAPVATSLSPSAGGVQDQLCQSLYACKGDIAISIDAASATTLDDPADIKLAAAGDEEIAQHDTAAPLASPEIVSLEASPPVMPSEADDGLPRQVKLADLVAKTPTGDRTAQIPLQTTQQPEVQNPDVLRSPSDAREPIPESNAQTQVDNELGTIRAKPIKTRRDDLGVLRLLQTASPPPRPKRPIAFLTGRLGYIDSDNAFRLDNRISEQTYQSGLAFRAYPQLSKNTSLYAIAETSLGRFERRSDRGYNEVELQLGVRQKLFPRTYAQLGLRNQRFYSFGYERQILGITYIDTSLSHRSILNKRTTLDSFYQGRVGFADRKSSSRIRQTLTFSLNYAATKDLRASLLYQLGLEDYTEISRFDTFQQIIASISYRVTPESRITLFGGTRFGNSSGSIRTGTDAGRNPVFTDINLDDTFYGAELSVNLPLF